ncbi:PREDICTED: probable LRR receptor-like serine/threonine-protein kinase At2g16250 [Camelina sativa]|uniref:Probable LRR receptor-like serine/threonine-protein kinase At2g16250 n=1 Tax=Camelina sativa TaxID=90675 RepID=A0ABM0U7A8_CAMSA|nr:PREDICTED: probable LRR receptor-like serine/threonine-protein kinase At2g16250 [Camelina sativa]XP_019087074.1 PREDICTED: probable LRR receptor-like serine/threonine-protein kinase At2g16250 [Camelina sativa]
MVILKKTSLLVFFFFFFVLLLESTFQQQTSSLHEKSALLLLRSSLGIRSRDWPVKGNPCLNWNGIDCDKNGRVTDINISGFRRTRIGNQNPQFSVDALLNLTRLASFNASRFSLPGPIPPLFGSRLLTLEVLDLSSCSITGTIPATLTRRLLRLTVLDLSNNSISGKLPPSLTSLQNLSVLDISSNSVFGLIPANIGALSKLQRLNLSHNTLSSAIPSSLGDLSALVDLDLSFNHLSGSVPSDLKGLRNLQTLAIAGNRLSGSLSPDLFSFMSKLQIVDFRGSGFIGVLPSRLWSLPELRLLDLSGNHFSDLLPNTTDNIDSTVSMLNISGNMFYGNLTLLLRRFQVVDLSENYFEGEVPDFVPTNASLSNNCLQGPENQRKLSDCTLFYSKKGLTFNSFGPPEEKKSPKSSWLSHRKIVILAAVGGSILVMLILILLPITVSFCVRRRNRSSTSNHPRGRHNGVGPLPPDGTLPSRGGVSINFGSLGSSFTYQQLLNATKEFRDSNLIKKGQSGDLFKGVLENGVQIVVKRISLESTKNNEEAYLTELDFFSRFAHPRIVPFVGKCLESTPHKCLVYKYMPNRDLPSSLFYKTSSLVEEGLRSLDWITRLKIALGVAEGLAYLHHDCSPPVVHRDVQASSILLDDKFEVRLGSFSKACHQENNGRPRKIARLLRLSQSSQESVPGSSATATCAYDVYCFGKILLELITGKLGISSCDETQFKKILAEIMPYISSQEKEPVMNILDQSLLVDEDLLEEVWAMAIVARSCLNPKQTRRPLMRHIVQALENPMRVVREDSSESERFRTTGSSRGSSSSGRVFGSWRQSLSDPVAAGTSSLLSQAEGLPTGSMSTRESSRGASSRRSMKDV